MIVVFTRHPRPFLGLDVSPELDFRMVQTVKDVMGVTFTGVIHCHDWQENKQAVEAHQYLRERQPELFNDVRGTYY